MPITTRSPYSGQPVKIRDQDVGRAVRDADGRVFYVVPRPNGEGFYASLTRKGSAKDEQRFDALLAKDAVLTEHRAVTNPGQSAGESGVDSGGGGGVVDATGKGRRSPAGRLVVIALVLAALAVGVWYGKAELQKRGLWPTTAPAENTAPGTAPESDPTKPNAQRSEASDVAPGASSDVPPGGAASAESRNDVPKVNPVGLQLAPPPSWAWRDDAASRQQRAAHGVPVQLAGSAKPAERADPEGAAGRSAVPAVRVAMESTAPTPGTNTPRTNTPGTGAPRPGTPRAAPAESVGSEPSDASPVRLPWLPRTPDPYFDFRRTASGLRYRIETPGTGPIARAKDYAVVRYRITHPPTGLELDATPEDAPLGFVVWSGTVSRGLDEGVAGMHVGEKRTLLVPAKLVTAGSPVFNEAGPGAPATLLRVDVELLNVLPGVRKQTKRPGQGPIAMPGDTIQMHWSLYVGQSTQPVLDSRQFGEPTTVRLGAGDVVLGLELGIAGMAQGEVADLFIPPYLGYGADGAAAGLVPPHAAIRCRVELLKVGM